MKFGRHPMRHTPARRPPYRPPHTRDSGDEFPRSRARSRSSLDKRRTDDRHFGAGIEQDRDLSRGDLAAANHQASAASDIEKYGNVCHRFGRDPIICAACQTVLRSRRGGGSMHQERAAKTIRGAKSHEGNRRMRDAGGCHQPEGAESRASRTRRSGAGERDVVRGQLAPLNVDAHVLHAVRDRYRFRR